MMMPGYYGDRFQCLLVSWEINCTHRSVDIDRIMSKDSIKEILNDVAVYQ
jgi:hypothetical protein